MFASIRLRNMAGVVNWAGSAYYSRGPGLTSNRGGPCSLIEYIVYIQDLHPGVSLPSGVRLVPW